jgi:chitin synthase
MTQQQMLMQQQQQQQQQNLYSTRPPMSSTSVSDIYQPFEYAHPPHHPASLQDLPQLQGGPSTTTLNMPPGGGGGNYPSNYSLDQPGFIPGSPYPPMAQTGSLQLMPTMGNPLRARKATIRHIPLTPEGNLVIDVPVPDRVLYNAKYRSGDEFTHMRYTAVTCTPDEFPTRGYSLRQQESKRHTEIFIVVTM